MARRVKIGTVDLVFDADKGVPTDAIRSEKAPRDDRQDDQLSELMAIATGLDMGPVVLVEAFKAGAAGGPASR